MNLSTITLDGVKKTLSTLKYVWFNDDTNKNFDVNIVCIRNSNTNSKVTNLFDDAITISYKENGVWKFHAWEATTDPGKKGVLESKNTKGIAILVPGQYRSTHIIRKHQGKYDAVCQEKTVSVYRDRNKDLIFDMNSKTIDDGIFGINIHRSNPKTESTFVENWSEGCQVFKKVKDFNLFMKICNNARKIHGNSFTVTLIESKDIK
jgi:hypothetical protein